MNGFSIPQLIRAPSKFSQEHGSRQLSFRAASGELVRVRRGRYLPAKVWESLAPWEKYRMRIQAVDELARSSPIFARESAAQILGLPVIGIPRDVQTVIPSTAKGGQSSNGIRRLPAPELDPPPWEVDGLRVTQPHITARDLAVRLPLRRSLAAMDKVVSGKVLPNSPLNVPLTFTVAAIEEAIGFLPSAAQRRRALRVLGVANGLSQSPGESVSRAIMIENQFPPPALQVPLYDSAGLIGYPDFLWEELKIIGEFDGYEKYSAQGFLQGKTPSDVVVREKRREDRLRAIGYTVIRWVWEDIRDPARLIDLLQRANIRQHPG